MSDTDKPPARKSLPAVVITLLALGLLGYVLWHVDQSPKTDDAYVYADTINVVPEVSGRIVELPVATTSWSSGAMYCCASTRASTRLF